MAPGETPEGKNQSGHSLTGVTTWNDSLHSRCSHLEIHKVRFPPLLTSASISQLIFCHIKPMIINDATAVHVSDCDQLKFSSSADKYFFINLATLDLWRKLSASQ